MLNEDEDFLAELDGPMVNSEEHDCHEEELNDYHPVLNSEELDGLMLNSEELDGPMLNSEEPDGQEELNDYQDELDDDLNHLLNSEEDIPEDVLNDLENSSFIADIKF